MISCNICRSLESSIGQARTTIKIQLFFSLFIVKLTEATSRSAAAEILCRLFASRTPVKAVFDDVVNHTTLAALDRSMTMQLVYGVLRQRQRLDRILQLLSKTKINKLDPFLHQAVAVGLMQIFFLDRIPESAAVNEAVNSLKWAGKPKRLQGFCNGILRESIRQKQRLQQQSQTDQAGAPVTNHPQWLTTRWRRFWGGEEADRICAVNSTEPQTVLRINTSRISRDKVLALFTDQSVSCSPGLYSEAAVILPDYRGSLASLPGFSEGWFTIQDEAAQLAANLLQPFVPAGRYLDGCAGLGGKTIHLLDLTAEQAPFIQAVEPENFRLGKLHENLDRNFPTRTVAIFEGTLADLATQHPQPYDGILIDAPCSGTGVIHRHPDIRWNREPQELQHYQARQLEILDTASQLLLPGGILVYATCSLEPEENQDVIERFCATHPGFSLTDCRPYLPETAQQFVAGNCFAPHPDATIDGFFAARLQLQRL